MDETDRDLIELLRINAREPLSSLARKLDVARSTVADRLAKLESKGIIAGYTIRYSDEYRRRRITAHVMISVNPKLNERVVHGLKQMIPVTSLYAVSGTYDMIAVVHAETTEDIDAALDAIGRLPGVEDTRSSILLSTKFER